MIGTTLSHHHSTAKLGAGGMGASSIAPRIRISIARSLYPYAQQQFV